MLLSLYHPGEAFTVGILGGGQLAKMSATAAYRLGLHIAIIEHGEQSPAGIMTKFEYPDGWTSERSLEHFVTVSDVITLENEFIDPEILEFILERRPVFPTPDTVRLVQDKVIQKTTMLKAGIPVPKFAAIGSVEEAYQFGRDHGYPYLIKTRTLGYDGYGNQTVHRDNNAMVAFTRFTGDPDNPRQILGEKFVRFRKELAVIVARNARGEIVTYPCVETIQEQHICRWVLAPAPIDPQLRHRAQEIAVAAVECIQGVGVFGVEMFLADNDDIIFNEIAPRPHNSGHYSIEACYTSQFENHIRAICNLPLGSADMITPAAAMMNILGTRNGSGVPDIITGLLRHPRVALHLYGKKDSRVGRKMGHLTTMAASLEEARQMAEAAANDLAW